MGLPRPTLATIVAVASLLSLHGVQGDCVVNVTTVPSNASSYWTVDIVNSIIAAHNAARADIAPIATAMPPATWSWDLAAGAQAYMDSCPGFVHSPAAQWRQNKYGFTYIGENLAGGMTWSDTAFILASSLWIQEKDYYTYTTATCTGGAVCGTCVSGQQCGHYTQVIWYNSVYIGCGYNVKCSGLPIYACWYGPGGNFVNNGPYTLGKPPAAQTCPTAPGGSGAGTPAPVSTSGGGGTSTTTTASPPSGGTSSTPAPPATPPQTGSATTTTAPVTTRAGTVTTTAAPAGSPAPGSVTPSPASGPATPTPVTPAPTPTTNTTGGGAATDDSGGTNSTPIIIGVVVAVVLLVGLIGGVVVVLKQRSQRSAAKESDMTDLHRMMNTNDAAADDKARSAL